MKRIYLDYASLTPIDPRVVREVKKYSSAKYANPSSIYKEGVAAKKAMEEGRKKVAGFLHVHGDEIVFTSGGTEANGLALEGSRRVAHRSFSQAGIGKPHLIISTIEHSSIMETANMLEKQGVEVTRLAVNSSGVISLDELKKAIKPNTFLVSIMMVNNETGAVQPIREAVKIVRHARKAKIVRAAEGAIEGADSVYPLFHTDAAQALYEDLNLESLGVDLLTLDGSKMYGPRGIGCLFIRRETPIEPIIYGGGQERGMRSGTENVQAIMGFAKALEIIGHGLLGNGCLGTGHYSQLKRSKSKSPPPLPQESIRIARLNHLFIEKLQAIRSDIIINGAKTSPHILNVSIPGINNEFFVLQLDAKGIACSTKSSCLRDEDESYVLKAMGADSKTSIRFSFGRWTKKSDIIKTTKVIGDILRRH